MLFRPHDLALDAVLGGVGAAASLAITAVSAVGMLGMGLQGVGLGLSGLDLSGSLATQLFMAGTSTAGWSASAAHPR